VHVLSSRYKQLETKEVQGAALGARHIYENATAVVGCICFL